MVVAAALALAGGACTVAPADPRTFDTGPQRAPAWSVRLPANLGHPLRAQPTGDLVVVHAEKGIAALSRADGSMRWQRPLSGISEDQVTIAGTALVVVRHDGNGQGHILDLATGAERAAFTGGENQRSVVVTTTGVYAANQVGYGSRLTAYDLPGGAVRWHRDYPLLIKLAAPPMGSDANPLAAQEPGPLVVAAQQTGDAWRATTVAADTGADIGTITPPVVVPANAPDLLELTTGERLAGARC